jgi:hypothetical protein
MFSSSRKLPTLAVVLALTPIAFAGGPRWIAGSSDFNSSVKGQPVHWKNGSVSYYLDQGR